MTSHASICVLIGVALLAGAICLGQEPVQEPEMLKKLREGFHQSLRIPTGLMNDFYAKALSTSERTFAAKGDYQQALALKARRLELAAIGLQAATAAEPVAAVIPLAASQAKFSGVVTEKDGELVNWRTAACGAEWTLTKFSPGTYKFELSCMVTQRTPVPGSTKPPPEPATALSYVLKDTSLIAAASKNICGVTLTPTTEFTTVASQSGIQLTRPPVTLKLSPIAAYPGNLVVIREIKLIQIAAATAPSAPVVAVVNHGEELAKLKQGLIDRLAAVRRPVVQEYLTKLDALTVSTKPNDALTDRIEDARRQAKKALTEVTLKTPHIFDNFDEIEDARFVPDPSNTGDNFKVATKSGAQMRVRLAFISCPPKDPTAREMKIVTERFNIDVDSSLELATSATEFTAEYLHDRPLRLLVRQSHKKDEAPMAFLFLDDIGLFQSVLIDHGLAVVENGDPASKSPTRENEYLVLLREREAQARKQTPRPGGWGLSLSKP